jgi:MerR family transcriptional regulator, light-induced transcriptional regulator
VDYISAGEAISGNNESPLKAKYSIKDLERLSGIKAHTIRIWEQRYNLLSPSRTDTNIRLYTDAELKLLLNVASLLKSGCKISHLSKMSNAEISEKISLILKQPSSEDQYLVTQSDNLIIAMLELNDKLFDSVIKESSIKYGFEKTMLHVIIPFLYKVGIMWRTGEVGVIQEHFISNLIRRKMILAIEEVGNKKNTSEETFLLFLPEGELHELGLLFSHYLIKSNGRKVIYLGQTVPIEDVIKFCKEFNPKYLLTFFTAAYNPETIEKYLLELANNSNNTTLLVAGNQLKEVSFQHSDRVLLLNTPQDLIRVLEKP